MSEQTVAQFEGDGFVAKIYLDDCAEYPFPSDGLVKIVAWHSRYTIGNCEDFGTPEAFGQFCKVTKVVRVPVYLHDHSGITVSTEKFSDPWDSGLVGFAFMTKEVAEQAGVTDPHGLLCQTVAVLDQYLRGEVYGYQIFKVCQHCGSCESSPLDSCWGIYGLETACEDARAAIKALRGA